MKKLAALMLGLAMVAFNALADVNVNTATKVQLETLKGIGPGKAQAIIDYRTKNGPFKSLDDLDKVKGIGPGVIKQIKGDVKFSGDTTVKAADKGSDKAAPKKAEPAKTAAPAAKAETKAEAKADTKSKADAKTEAKTDAKTDAKAKTKADAKTDDKAKK